MKNNDLIKENIEALKSHQVKLYSYLYDLVDKPLSVDSRFLENIYSGFLDDNRSEIRKISIYALLFFLKIKKDKYKLLALQWAKNTNNDEELRLCCMAGLSQAYIGSKEPQLLSFFSNVFTNPNEDDNLRTEGFTGMMKVLGLTSIEIMQKNQNNLVISFDDIDVENFSSEFEIIDKLKALG